MTITIKSSEQIETIKKNGQILREAINEVLEEVEIGSNTFELDQIIAKHLKYKSAIPTFLGYGAIPNIRDGFPKNSCQSLNEVLVHGIPHKNERLKSGDLLSIDVGVSKDGFIADSCFSFGVGKISEDNQKLLEASLKITLEGIKFCKPGVRVLEITNFVSEYAKTLGYKTMPDLYGHGVGRNLHEAPSIPFAFPINQVINNSKLEPGMVITIEPVVVPRTCNLKYKEEKDKWTLTTIDKSWSSQFEHTIVILSDGCEILTGEFPKSLNY